MKTRQAILRVVSILAFSLHLATVADAQDLAAAARANRAKKETARRGTADSEWYKMTHLSLRGEDKDGSSELSYEISDTGDMRITLDTVEQGKRETSEIMLIHGRRQWMLAKSVRLEEGYEIDMLDAPVLELQLALELLRAAAPNGPLEITEKMSLEVAEESRSITVNTASASGGLEAPWTLHAVIEPAGPNRWSFQLSAAHGEPFSVTGTWQKEATAPAFHDEMPLDGWQILSIGPIKRETENSTIYDYGAQPSPQRAKTLGELRSM